MKIVVLDGYTLNPGDLSWDELKTYGDLTVYDRTPPELVTERAIDAEVLFTNKVILERESLKQLKNLKYIGVLATGTNAVDLDAAGELGIEVTNVPAYSTDSVAQLVFALLLELCHMTFTHSTGVKKGKWSRNPDFCYKESDLIELAGKTMGIIGFGQIGRQVALIAQAMGMDVLYFNRSVKEAPGLLRPARRVDLKELLEKSDVVSLNCPLTEETRGLISAKELALMKKTAFLINTARGPLVNEIDVAFAVKEKKIAGYGADVMSEEPPPADHPFYGVPDIVITPHIAWQTKEARSRLMKITVDNLASFLKGKTVNSVM